MQKLQAKAAGDVMSAPSAVTMRQEGSTKTLVFAQWCSNQLKKCFVYKYFKLISSVNGFSVLAIVCLCSMNATAHG